MYGYVSTFSTLGAHSSMECGMALYRVHTTSCFLVTDTLMNTTYQQANTDLGAIADHPHSFSFYE